MLLPKKAIAATTPLYTGHWKDPVSTPLHMSNIHRLLQSALSGCKMKAITPFEQVLVDTHIDTVKGHIPKRTGSRHRIACSNNPAYLSFVGSLAAQQPHAAFLSLLVSLFLMFFLLLKTSLLNSLTKQVPLLTLVLV